jgi:hypothetical protein
VKERDFIVKPLLFKITSMSVNALINGNVKTGQSPETQENKLSFQVDLSVGFMLPPYLSGSKNQINTMIIVLKFDKFKFPE